MVSSMVSRTRQGVLFVLCAAGVASSVSAKGWDPLEYTLRLNAYGTSSAFPGSAGTAPDQGFEPALEAGSSVRAFGVYKVNLSASAGAHVQQDFNKANYSWFAAGTQVRRSKTVVTLDGEYVPHRNKFPSDPEEGGPFKSWATTLGVRQALNDRMRVRVEGMADREKFEPAFSLRDARGRELYGQFGITPTPGTDLRLEGAVAHDQTTSPKYTKDTHWLGIGVVWSGAPGRADLGVRSSVRRYGDALLGDSNFERRDQSIDVRLRLTREVRPGMTVALGATAVNQTSSRIDRNYDVHTFSLGFEWTGGGKKP